MKKILIIVFLAFGFFHINRTNNYISSHFRETVDQSLVTSYYDLKPATMNQHHASAYECILLLVIDGLRADRVFTPDITPRLANFVRSNGIMYTDATAMLPTVSAPNYMSLLSGAPPFIHGVTSNSSKERAGAMPITLFESLRTCGMDARIIGFEWYKEMFGKTGAVYIPAECCEKDDPLELAGGVSMLFKSGARPALTIVHFLGPDNASHKYASGAEYYNAVRDVDSAVGTIIDTVRSLEPRSLFIITSDHGVEDDGTHGGDTRHSRHIPLCFYADTLPPESVSRSVTSLSIAPTIAALLDIHIPPLSCGTILHETMDAARAKKYVIESIGVKERLLESTGRKSAGVMTLTMDDRENLTRRDHELTMSILDLYTSALRPVPVAQRFLCFILFISLSVFVIYRSPPGVIVPAAINALFICISGALMPLINSSGRLSTALSLMSLSTLAFVAFHHYLFSSRTGAGLLRETGEKTGLLALLMSGTLILAGFFIPVNPDVPDLGVYPFRFFFAACTNTLMMFLLLVFSYRIALHPPNRTIGKKND